ncbi:hypothetical protein DIU31_025510 [Mucilaginibacter rubeus]|uniref:Lipocalin-like domain-containing protein n=1 Tax=Mucilaginibacter rubeus TaxID=2027860 RepID=A0AAE6JJE0_9SPHI|nr:hypothetical protein [Mucilaginibacter rubeus]QEM06700.1 hypothetical protein DIU31_025510 [Mucilaginibacter rubeus]QTE44168.1 hypothetical protein J3L19_01935 [Mucilaginibacter rubeus]QTE50769.1 hypothetical protein J3L21_01915 [Mucilaginibacter rubeus]QTE55851.1 hypothetical protein J3L23_27150 [Mucilaginibacter rubeus]QTE64685.1 hypothetical protein J3L22_06670 [Mucilaginibacter rubeus]
MKNLIPNIFLLIYLALITSCQFDPYAGDLTTEQPKREDVIGVYQFKEQTISQIQIDKRSQRATITLKSDGTYQANNIPNVFGGPNAENHKYISAKGSWKIETIGAVDNGWGHPKSNWGITLTSIDESLTNISFTGKKKPYGLMVTFDDPDLAYGYAF